MRSNDWEEDIGPAQHAALSALAAGMAEGGRDRHAPVREIFGLLGDRWSTLILLILSTGGLRHAALRRTIDRLADEEAISQRMLTLKLRALQRDGLIIRSATTDVPPRVDYALTALGQGLVEQVDTLINWIKLHRSIIDEARARFAEKEQDRPW